MNEFNKINWHVSQLAGGFVDDDFLTETSVTFKLLNDRLPCAKSHEFSHSWINDMDSSDGGEKSEEDVSIEELATPRKYIPGLEGNLGYPRKSSLAKDEQALYIQLSGRFRNKKITATTVLTAEETRLFARYQEMNERVASERVEFQQFLKDNWKLRQTRFFVLHKDIVQFTSECWRHRLSKVTGYPRYYDKEATISLIYPASDRCVELTPGDILLQMGVLPLVVPPTLNHPVKICREYARITARFPPDCRHPDDETKETLHKLPVSVDPNARRLAEAYGADVVISAGTLKHLADNLAPYDRQWDVPVSVAQAQDRRIVYVDKPLGRKTMTAVERNQAYHKTGLKMLMCHPRNNRAFRFPYNNEVTPQEPGVPPGSDNADVSSDNESQPQGADDGLRRSRRIQSKAAEEAEVKVEREETKRIGFLMPGQCDDFNNASYQLWTLQSTPQPVNKHSPTEKLKKAGDVKHRSFKILVRSKCDGAAVVKGAVFPACLSVKLEYQSPHGGEKNGKEVAVEYLSMLFRPRSTLHRVRVNAETSEVLHTAKLTLEDVARDCHLACGIDSVGKFPATLYSVLAPLLDARPGRYLLSHAPTTGPFCVLMHGNTEFGSVDLHSLYQQVDVDAPPLPGALPWRTINTDVMMAYHHAFKRVPGLFLPPVASAKKNEKPKDPAKVLVQAKKNKTKKKRAKMKKKPAGDST